MARKEFCEKDVILITYTEKDVCFEDCLMPQFIRAAGYTFYSEFVQS